MNQTAAIDDADTFPVVILKATRCKLTYSESCRRHWTMAEDEPWDRAPPLTARGAPAPRPDDDHGRSRGDDDGDGVPGVRARGRRRPRRDP